jgi:hypothetical protein
VRRDHELVAQRGPLGNEAFRKDDPSGGADGRGGGDRVRRDLAGMPGVEHEEGDEAGADAGGETSKHVQLQRALPPAQPGDPGEGGRPEGDLDRHHCGEAGEQAEGDDGRGPKARAGEQPQGGGQQQRRLRIRAERAAVNDDVAA